MKLIKKFLPALNKAGTRIQTLKRPNRGMTTLRQQFNVNILKYVFKLIRQIEATTKEDPRIKGKNYEKIFPTFMDIYTVIPTKPEKNQGRLLKKMVNDLLVGAPLWRSQNLYYNVGAAVNRVSSTLYSIALDLNIFNINDGLAGNSILAEQAVARIMSELGGVDYRKSCGFFTFGGTATNLYAVKLALAKALPDSRQNGITENIKILLTEDSHFSHLNVLNWLGVGTKNAIIVKATEDRTSDVSDAATKMKEAINQGFKIPAMILNGGTTYDNAIDNIEAFVKLRDDLVIEFELDYVPHIHIDSVIGWSWLMFKDYDFDKNTLEIEAKTLALIKSQYKKISKVHLVDSWGVDFHKGIGSCPVPCSIIMINKSESAGLLSYKNKTDNHQLAHEFSHFSPVDYTLETSRPAGASLAALGALMSLGIEGFQSHLANLIQQNQLFRELINSRQRNDIAVININSPGFVTMVRLYPTDTPFNSETGLRNDGIGSEYVQSVNAYMKSFFEFDLESRMKGVTGSEYSYSSTYITSPSGEKVSALKFYPTSPYVTEKNIGDAVKLLFEQKNKYDKINFHIPR